MASHRGVGCIAAAMTLGFSAAALAQTNVTPIPGTAPPLTTRVVNNGPGNQSDPHVSNQWVSYTDDSAGLRVRYHNLTTNADAAVPLVGVADWLSDVSGTAVVFSAVDASNNANVELFDLSTPASPPLALRPTANAYQDEPRIGGNTVVWRDQSGPNASGLISQIYTYDRATATAQAVTSDAALNSDPAVSPDGSTIAWLKCAANVGVCDVWDATKASNWTPRQLTTAQRETPSESAPATNGALVSYASTRTGFDRDIYWQPVGGGTESHLVLAGDETRATISQNLIAFEHAVTVGAQKDIYLYDIASNTLYPLIASPANEHLQSLWTDGTLVRVVYTVDSAATGMDAMEVEFSLPAKCSGDGDDQICANPVATLTGETLAGAVDVQGACTFDASGRATFTFTATGVAAGPYPGTFVERGTIVQTFSPAILPMSFSTPAAQLTFDLSAGPASTVNTVFEIRSPAGPTLVVGTKQLLRPGTSACTDTYTAVALGGIRQTGNGTFRQAFVPAGALSYQALILTPSGVFSDHGTADLGLRRFLAPTIFDVGSFSEQFASSLALAQSP